MGKRASDNFKKRFGDPPRIKEFQSLYKAHFGIDLSFEEAAELGSHLIRFYKIINKK